MDDWYNDVLPRYPKVLIQRERADPSYSHVNARPHVGGNVIRIRVQGRRNGNTELEKPRVTVRRYSHSQSGEEPNVTVETIRHSSEDGATTIPIRHINGSPTTNAVFAQKQQRTSSLSRQPMKAVPLTPILYDSNANSINFKQIPSPTMRVAGRTSPLKSAYEPLGNKLVDSFEKQFDRFTAEYTSLANNHFARSHSPKPQETRNYSSRRHESDGLIAARRHHNHNSTNIPSPTENLNFRHMRATSPSVSRYSGIKPTTQRVDNSPSPTDARFESGPFKTKCETSHQSQKDNLVPQSVARAKWVLDRVLRDLVSKDGLKGRRNSVISEAKDTIKRFSNDLDSSKMSGADDTDSGYSGSGDTANSGFMFSTLEIREKISKYNESHKDSKLTEVPGQGDAFQGDIRICMQLDHPVNMLLNTKPTSLLHSMNNTLEEDEERITALATIPKNTTTKLHITSRDTTEVVIEQLLQKFNIIESSKGYGLYEQIVDNFQDSDKEVKLRKTPPTEKPLLNFLKWGADSPTQKSFVLKESYSSEIIWDSFSIPELSNFIRMLDMEYQNQVEIIRHKYNAYRHNVESRLTELKPEDRKT